jgi:glycine/D-amino acid oxidase-like deaminating enzyme
MPFAIDLDRQMIDWSEEERTLLLADPENAWLAENMPGAIHCRPDGGDGGKWIKLGWAYNEKPEAVSWQPEFDPRFPEIVLRGAARFNPALKNYYGRLPRETHHYGGYYTRTEDNWPLIGPMGPEGAFMACALSGHGTMAACATGELAAAWVAGSKLPDYARPLSLDRYVDPSLVAPINTGSGLL